MHRPVAYASSAVCRWVCDMGFSCQVQVAASGPFKEHPAPQPKPHLSMSRSQKKPHAPTATPAASSARQVAADALRVARGCSHVSSHRHPVAHAGPASASDASAAAASAAATAAARSCSSSSSTCSAWRRQAAWREILVAELQQFQAHVSVHYIVWRSEVWKSNDAVTLF